MRRWIDTGQGYWEEEMVPKKSFERLVFVVGRIMTVDWVSSCSSHPFAAVLFAFVVVFIFVLFWESFLK